MGPMSGYFKKQIKDSGLDSNIIYYGPMAAKLAASYFINADALYVSLKDEGIVGKTIPNKLMMYMAFGKPIIGVLEGDGKEVLQKSGGALLASADPTSIKEAIIALSHMDKKEKEHLGSLNKLYYDTHFSLKEVTREIEKHLK